MGVLGNISGKEAVRAFSKDGWIVDRQRGSHILLEKPDTVFRLCIPDHKELDRGTLRSIIRDSGLTVDEFLDLL